MCFGKDFGVNRIKEIFKSVKKQKTTTTIKGMVISSNYTAIIFPKGGKLYSILRDWL